MAGVRVRTGSRVHLGLIAPAPAACRRFGGAGWIVEDPGVELVVRPASRTDASGPLAERTRELARRAAEAAGVPGGGARVEVLRAPGEHAGLGTGTQLALAVAAGVASLAGERPGAEALARCTGRGQRSAVGVHGFARGGFIVDAGRRVPDGDGAPAPGAGSARDPSDSARANGDDIPAPLVAHHPVPSAWRTVLLLPRGGRGLSGEREHHAFARLPAPPPAEVDALCRLLLLGVLPALVAGDVAAFGAAAAEYGRRAGELFRTVQGGPFASAWIGRAVEVLEAEGAAGAGQSSWGPAVWAIVSDPSRAEAVAAAARRKLGLERSEVLVTQSRERPAAVQPGTG